MKQLELELKERLLIVELDSKEEADNELLLHKALKDDELIPICKGSELTEEVSGGLVDSLPDAYNVDWFKDYTVIDTEIHDDYTFLNALESFKSAIEAQRYYWGDNPVNFNDNEIDFNKRYEMRVNWEEAESRTFNPEKSIIFKKL